MTILRAYKIVRPTPEHEVYESITSRYLPMRYPVGEWAYPPECMVKLGYGFLTGFLKLNEARAFAKEVFTATLIVEIEAVLYQATIPPRVGNLDYLKGVANNFGWRRVVPNYVDWPKGTNFFSRVRVMKKL